MNSKFKVTLITLIALQFSLHAALSVTVTQNSDSSFQYDYRINNASESFGISSFSIEILLAPSDRDWNPTSGSGNSSITVANENWIAFASNEGSESFFQDFINLTPVANVSLGQNLSGFSITSQFAPQTTNFSVFGDNGESSSGTILSPALIPEPHSSVLFLLSFVAICARRTRKF